jgi:hypothetical protein
LRVLYGQSRMASAAHAVPQYGHCTGNPAWQVLYTRSRIAGTVRAIPHGKCCIRGPALRVLYSGQFHSHIIH